MSLAFTDLSPVKVLDPKTNLREHKKYLFKVPGNQVTYQEFTANSTGNSSTTWKLQTPGPSTLISRLMLHQEGFDVTIVSSGRSEDGLTEVPIGVGDLLPGLLPEAEDTSSADVSNYYPNQCNPRTGICPRQFPISSVTNTNKLSVNGDVLTNEPYKYIHALARFNLDDMSRSESISPAQCDEAQKYNDFSGQSILNQQNDGSDNISNAIQASDRSANIGDGRSPFAQFGQNGSELPRASYAIEAFTQKIVGTTVETKFRIVITEPIFISPLSSGDSNLMCLSQISNLDYYVSWLTGSFSRIFSVDKSMVQRNTAVEAALAPNDYLNVVYTDGLKANSRYIKNLTVNIGEPGQSKIFMLYITPQLNRVAPTSLIYDYNEFESHSQNVGIIPATGKSKSGFITSQTITLSSIPSRVYIFLRKKVDSKTMYDTDAFFNVDSINIQFNNVSGLLGSASEYDLFKMSQDCGFKQSWPSWKSYGGSVLCIPFSSAIGLPPNLAPGVLGQYSLQFKIGYKNLSTEAIDAEMVTVVHSVGVYTITNGGQILKQAAVVAASDTLNASEIAKEADSEVLEKLYGGSFMSGMKNIYHKVLSAKPYAKKGVKLVKDFADPLGVVAPRVSNILKSGADFADILLGQGYSEAQVNKMIKNYSPKDLKKMCAGMVEGGNMVAGNPVGGRALPKKRLQQRMMDY